MASGGTPWWRQRQRERFARAVDSSPQDSQPYDPKLAGELAVVVMLGHTAAATAPDGAARDRMRAKVLAQLAVPQVRPSPVPRALPAPRGRVTGTRGRLVIALGAAFCLVLALSGMTLLLSRNALPGDPLYAVRRTVESATLGLTSGGDAKGHKHLEFAADRIGDIETLAGRYPDLANSPVGDYLTAFADFDSDTSAGTVDLTGYATGNGPADLTVLRTWAAQQATRIGLVAPHLPTLARTRAAQSRALLDRVSRRADALLARDSCYTITSGATDDLGVLPATGPCDQAPGSPPRHLGATSTPPVGATLPVQVPAPPQTRSGGATAVTSPPVAGVPPTTFAAPPVVPPPVVGVPPVLPPVPITPPITITLPLPLPPLDIPALLPNLPALRIGD
ncbi:MAG TPA: DUF5667 domain-containing protein [Pseudonocardiaceae bacterium]